MRELFKAKKRKILTILIFVNQAILVFYIIIKESYIYTYSIFITVSKQSVSITLTDNICENSFCTIGMMGNNTFCLPTRSRAMPTVHVQEVLQ